MEAPAIELKNITKTFNRIIANKNVSFTINKGEILALLGENGSGKTTLMNIISGLYYPDAGKIFIDGKAVEIASPKDAFKYKIGMIHQHFKLVDVFSATENIILGIKTHLDKAASKKKIQEICSKYGFNVNPDQKIYSMSISQKQTVEIVKVLYRGAEILILDEPTAVLTPQETENLFKVLKNMKNDGKAVVIITHKLNEVMAISDRVVILRKGEYIGEKLTSQTNPQEITDMMVGHHTSLNIDRPEPENPQPILEIKNLTVTDRDGIRKLDDVSFTARTGEILGIAGISGCGQKELLESIAGLQKADSGQIIYTHDDGKKENILGKKPDEIRNMGIALSFVPEDRLGMGLVGSMDINDNMMLRSYSKGNGIFTDRKNPHKLAKHIVDFLEISTPNTETQVKKLSGGNVQKVLLGREISNKPKVIITAYATRGVDINSSFLIYNLLMSEKIRNSAVIYVGEDLDVLLELCDKLLVLCEGKVSGIVDCRNTDKLTVGAMMTSLGGIINEK